MEKFVCLHCGSSELSYEKWVKREDKVIVHDNGSIECYDKQIDTAKVDWSYDQYICGSCTKPLLFYDDNFGFGEVSTEDQLLNYLSLSIQERKEMLAL